MLVVVGGVVRAIRLAQGVHGRVFGFFTALVGGLRNGGFLAEGVAATVHIARLDFGRSLIARGVAVGSIAELPGDVPESAWRPHGPNPPRGHPVMSPMVAYVV
ncbi:hypothetical protein ABZU76_01820 [Amycolatopsis sp. NPDC005232]|uniref:hypothetical protein n=1 Tax=Amycolatopsis sp. NPDC005232 TaxID=3157027 RepID=UPI0033BCC281